MTSHLPPPRAPALRLSPCPDLQSAAVPFTQRLYALMRIELCLPPDTDEPLLITSDRPDQADRLTAAGGVGGPHSYRCCAEDEIWKVPSRGQMLPEDNHRNIRLQSDWSAAMTWCHRPAQWRRGSVWLFVSTLALRLAGKQFRVQSPAPLRDTVSGVENEHAV